MFRWLLRFLFPPKCVFCGHFVENDHFSVCKDCFLDIPYNHGYRCTRCDTPIDAIYGDGLCKTCKSHKRGFDKVYAPLLYKDTVRKSIIGFKFHGKIARSRTFASFIVMHMREASAPHPDIITYVPMHPKKEMRRGYNQAKLLAEDISATICVPVVSTLKKCKDTSPQSSRSRRERFLALRGVFAFSCETDIKGKCILLIDDILTTGATLDTCARILKKAGAKQVIAATCAVTPPVGYAANENRGEFYDTTSYNNRANSFR